MQSNFKRFWVGFLVVYLAGLVGCTTSPKGDRRIAGQPFGRTPDGTPVEIFTLRNASGCEARITTYGGIVVSLKVPDRHGQLGDVVLGFEKLDDYIKDSPYFGALIGRYGNRIARGKFVIDGDEYKLAINNPPNALHGGVKGFDKVVWTPRIVTMKSGPGLELRHLSKDGEEGYPGNLSVTAIYSLTDKNELQLEYTATTDKSTVLNLSHHSYFNLAGRGDVLGHEVMINADRFTPVDENLIPTGELRPVAGTPFDFRKMTGIGTRINEPDAQLKFGKGYDHNWAVNKRPGVLGLMARAYEPTSGRTIEVFSTAPGLQLYTGNFLDGSHKGKAGWVYQFRQGFSLEPQEFPDAPNQPQFPSSVLRPGETYRSTMIYRFSVRR